MKRQTRDELCNINYHVSASHLLHNLKKKSDMLQQLSWERECNTCQQAGNHQYLYFFRLHSGPQQSATPAISSPPTSTLTLLFLCGLLCRFSFIFQDSRSDFTANPGRATHTESVCAKLLGTGAEVDAEEKRQMSTLSCGNTIVILHKNGCMLDTSADLMHVCQTAK